jgi:hypothetical protein
MAPFTRRDVLVGGSVAGTTLLIVGCGDDGSTVQADAPPGGGDAAAGADAPPGTGDGPPPRLDATPQCEEHPLPPVCADGETEPQILGPFYTAGAPTRTVLVEPADPGVRLSVSGTVMSTNCALLPGALIDVWQADDTGAYDSVGFRFRGVLNADAKGAYRFDTIIPGRYLNGAQYRPAHIHVRVSAAGHVLLTTQLYFACDPYNDIDPFLHPSLIMDVVDESGGAKSAVFHFVLAPT